MRPTVTVRPTFKSGYRFFPYVDRIDRWRCCMELQNIFWWFRFWSNRKSCCESATDNMLPRNHIISDSPYILFPWKKWFTKLEITKFLRYVHLRYFPVPKRAAPPQRGNRSEGGNWVLMNSCIMQTKGSLSQCIQIPPSCGAILLSISKMIAHYLGWNIMRDWDGCLAHEASEPRNLLFHDLRPAHY